VETFMPIAVQTLAAGKSYGGMDRTEITKPIAFKFS
jgi:hypothetical protein